MDKSTRHYTIREIISSRPITTQEQLRRELGKRGLRVTQATLSRDMNELGIAWQSGGNGGRYALQQEPGVTVLRPIVGAEVVAITANECLIVVRTLPGCANTVGEYIDMLHHPDIIGTVAGDNTLLVIPSSAKLTTSVLQLLKHTLIESPRK